MKIFKLLLYKLLQYRYFRILLAASYPGLKKLKLVNVAQKLNKGKLTDPFDKGASWENGHFRTYNLENFDVNTAIRKYSLPPESFMHHGNSFKFGFLLDPNHVQDAAVEACKAAGIRYVIYDITDPDLMGKLMASDCDGIFIVSFSNTVVHSVFSEITNLILTETKLRIYPTLRELNFYESKRALASFLVANDIPHPVTKVFYDFDRAAAYLEACSYPIVFKTSSGASASGVEILKTKKQAIQLARNLFFKYYLRKLESEKRNIEWGYMLLQDFVRDAKEFRIIKVGDSWFGYQKWKEDYQTYFSGSGTQKMINPSLDLLDFCYDIAAKFGFTTMCFDIFQDLKGNYLVNELQTWFGSYDPSEMYVDNVPGRYRKLDGTWIFEPGFYNVYGSNLLRINHFASLLQKENLTVN